MLLSNMLPSTPCNEIEIKTSAMLADFLCNLYQYMKSLTKTQIKSTYVPRYIKNKQAKNPFISFTTVIFKKPQK